MLTLVPPPAGKPADVPGNVLFQVHAESIFHGRGLGMSGDVRTRRSPGQEGSDGISINSHVGVILETKQPELGVSLAEQPWMQFEFVILRARPRELPLVLNSIGDGWHQSFRKAKGPVAVVVFRVNSYGVPARVCRVVICAIVDNRPVHELQVAVAADGINVEEIV